MPESERRKVAVIGAGWAGCAAAVELAGAGLAVSLFEANMTPGGRARRLTVDGMVFDNGQHILLGAYENTLRMMKKVGTDPALAFLRVPLQICYPQESSPVSFVASKLPAPFHLLGALFRATGFKRADRLALARFLTAARWMDWKLNTDCSVTTLLERFGQTENLYNLLWHPICVSALNTLPDEASAQIFLNMLRDSIGARRKASDMLVPCKDLSALFPDRAVEFVQRKGGRFFAGRTVRSVEPQSSKWRVDGELFDAVVMATGADAASRLLRRHSDMSAFDALEGESIHTCYFGYSPDIRLSRPFYALKEDTADEKWGQFVFDRGWLDTRFAGTMAAVISRSSSLPDIARSTLETKVSAQLALAFNMPQLEHPLWSKTISVHNATFICRPALERPETRSGQPGLVFAGDYVRSDYAGTLESAVQSGIIAAKCILSNNWFGN